MRAPIRLAATATTLLSGALLAVGCGDAEAPTTTRTIQEPPLLEISLTVTGGYPPSVLRVRVHIDGTGSVFARGPAGNLELGPAKLESLTLDADELLGLNGELADADIASLDRAPQVCADCLIYTLRYGYESFSSDMLTIPPELSGPIHELERLAGRDLPPRRATTPPR